MTAVTLMRADATRNMFRFYRLDVQPDLFGAWCFVREWGRIGQAGQVRIVPYPTPDAAEAALRRQRRAKERRGYAASRAAGLAGRAQWPEGPLA
jgi:predicted DNA-binding WGR domain protein